MKLPLKRNQRTKIASPEDRMTLTEHLRDIPDTDEKQVREALSGHLCRCTGYDKIVRAVLDANPALRAAARFLSARARRPGRAS